MCSNRTNDPRKKTTGNTTRRCISALILLIVAFGANRAWGQISGRFLGTVTDASDAVVPNAEVTLENVGTGFLRTTSTDQNGNYEFLAVPGSDGYRITVAAPGFEKAEQTGLKLLVNQEFRADFKLRVGAVAAKVTVSGAPVQVESHSTQLGDVIEDQKMEVLPLNGRSYLDLLGLQTGVTPVVNPGAFQAVQSASGILTEGEVSVNGQQDSANSYMVNGASVEDVGSNGAGIIPTLDSIQEFRLLTNSFDTEFGGFSGAVVNVITKSGTNAYHGSAFEFLRNQDLDSRNYFGPTRGAFRRNQFGGTIGGPILKNRVFFFGDYQGTRQTLGLSTGIVLVPSAAQLTGDLSSLEGELTGVVRGDNAPGHMASTLSSELGYTVTAGEPYYVSGCTSLADAQAGMCVFPNAQIPQAAWSNAAKGTLQFIPPPNGSGNAEFPSYASSSLNQNIGDDKTGIRIDFAQSPSNNWSFYYHYDNALLTSPLGAPNVFGTADNIPGFSYTEPSRAQVFVLSDTKIFSSTKVNEVHISYHRIHWPGPTPTGGLGKVSGFGFTEGGLGLIPSEPSIEGLPSIILNELGLTMGAAYPTLGTQNHYQALEGFSWIIGKHTLKMGGAYYIPQWARRGGPAPNGLFVYNGGETGVDFADYLLGAPDLFNQSSFQAMDARSKYGAAYIQDSFRVRPNLTINYGLRWEFSEPWWDNRNRIQAFNPGEQSVVFAQSPTGWDFPNDPGVPKTLAPTRWDNFAPRLGLAYSLTPSGEFLQKILGGSGQTSIRAGAGKFYTSYDTEGISCETGDAPFGFYYDSPSLIYMDNPFQGRASGLNPGQRFPFVAPPNSGSSTYSFAPFQPIAGSCVLKKNAVMPYALTYNLTVQRQIGKSAVLTVGYVGTQGRHLFALQDFNPGNAQTCLQIAQAFSNAGQASSGCGPYGEDTIYSLGSMTWNGTRPFSVTSGRYLDLGELDFGDNPYIITSGVSNYNSLQMTFDKRVGSVRLLGAYTWSKAMNTSSTFTEYLNYSYPGLSKELSTDDMTNNFVVSYLYDLPFAHGLSRTAGPAYKALHGWQITGITRFTTGFPVTLQETDDRSLCGCDGSGLGSVNLPNYDGQPIQRFNPRTNATLQYFGTSPFSAMALGVPGNANRRFFHGPGLNDWDMGLLKNAQITERTSLQFRGEFFNVFNHAQFMTPVGNYIASNFGQVTAARDPRIGQVSVKFLF